MAYTTKGAHPDGMCAAICQTSCSSPEGCWFDVQQGQTSQSTPCSSNRCSSGPIIMASRAGKSSYCERLLNPDCGLLRVAALPVVADLPMATQRLWRLELRFAACSTLARNVAAAKAGRIGAT